MPWKRRGGRDVLRDTKGTVGTRSLCRCSPRGQRARPPGSAGRGARGARGAGHPRGHPRRARHKGPGAQPPSPPPPSFPGAPRAPRPPPRPVPPAPREGGRRRVPQGRGPRGRGDPLGEGRRERARTCGSCGSSGPGGSGSSCGSCGPGGPGTWTGRRRAGSGRARGLPPLLGGRQAPPRGGPGGSGPRRRPSPPRSLPLRLRSRRRAPEGGARGGVSHLRLRGGRGLGSRAHRRPSGCPAPGRSARRPSLPARRPPRAPTRPDGSPGSAPRAPPGSRGQTGPGCVQRPPRCAGRRGAARRPHSTPPDPTENRGRSSRGQRPGDGSPCRARASPTRRPRGGPAGLDPETETPGTRPLTLLRNHFHLHTVQASAGPVFTMATRAPMMLEGAHVCAHLCPVDAGSGGAGMSAPNS